MIPSTNDTATLAAMTATCRLHQRRWDVLPMRQRLRPVRHFRHLLVENCDRLCAAVANDVGKLAEETIGAEILPLAEACRFLERLATRLLKPRRVAWTGVRPAFRQLKGHRIKLFRFSQPAVSPNKDRQVNEVANWRNASRIVKRGRLLSFWK
jgi:acyl-CoA reductase-like NAD-dependent aldehyde dehydrogenase